MTIDPVYDQCSKLWKDYYQKIGAFDRRVCTDTRDGEAWPADEVESILSREFSRHLRRLLEQQRELLSLQPDDSRWQDARIHALIATNRLKRWIGFR